DRLFAIADPRSYGGAAIMSTTQQGKAIPSSSGERPRSRRPRRWWYSAAVGVLGMVLLGAGQPPTSTPPTVAPSAPRPMNPATPGTTSTSPMDEPLDLIHKAQEAYRGVHDYTCLLIKRERINGVLPPDNVMEMKVRTQPFSVYLR